ncbi:MAG: hypothetical protein KDC13_04325 [Bacteroidetes bacterium]|nr:hypothetical protein [Bacteroidota bacterium]
MRFGLKPILLIFILGFAGCQSDSNLTSGAAKPYFDVPGYFSEAASSMQNSEIWLKKTYSVDGKQEYKRSKPASWQEEFAIFSSIDINKSSFIGKYQIDTTSVPEGIQTRYSCNDPKLPVKSLTIVEDSLGNIESIEAVKLDHSIVLDSEVRWQYIPSLGYTVSGKRSINNLAPTVFSVSAIFAN